MVIKAGKPQGCLPAPFGFWAGAVVEMRPTVRLISRRAPPAAPPLPRERERSLGVVEIWLNLSHISTETPINLREVLIVARLRPEPLTISRLL